MNVTLDQARALDAFARHGSLQGAAAALHKSHTTVLYALKQLEDQASLVLFDRRGYRTKLTPAGARVLDHCRRLLDAERSLIAACTEMASGWEPRLRIVFDGIYPAAPLLSAIGQLRQEGAPTRVEVNVDFLGAVEARFNAGAADVMVGVLTSPAPGVRVHRLPRLSARLVAHRSHPLAKEKKRLATADLARHVLLTVRGGDPRLGLVTADLERQSAIHLGDFHAKKAAIIQGIGFGWLPEWIAAREIASGVLVPLRLAEGSTHAFDPKLCIKADASGRASERFVELVLEHHRR